MDWMHTHQLSSKNLTAGEKVAMTMELQKEIALENKEKQLSTLKQNQINNRSVQMDKTESDERSHTAHTHTREQVAKMTGVGIGTVARYNRVMNSDDEAKQRKVAVEYVKLCEVKNSIDFSVSFYNYHEPSIYPCLSGFGGFFFLAGLPWNCTQSLIFPPSNVVQIVVNHAIRLRISLFAPASDA